MNKTILSILLILAIFSANGQSNIASDILKKSLTLDSLSQKWNTEKTPGLSIAIIENNRIVYSSNVGMANLEKGNKITSNTTFNLASLTKQFVAYSILLLEEGGKLSLDNDIRTYLPEIKYSGITVRHLLNHSSGIPEYWGIWRLSSFKGDSIEDIYGLLKAQKQTKFNPGDRYEYSNSNYILLSLIIKRVSGLALNDFAQENIFKKVGMNHTYFLLDGKKSDSNQAENYQFNGQNYVATPQPTSDIIGDGGLFSNIEDMVIWNGMFYDNSTTTIKRREVGLLNSGESSIYAAGLQKFTKNGIVSYEHGGGAQGASCYFSQIPNHKIGIIVLANTDDVNAIAIYESIKSIIFPIIKDSAAHSNTNNTDYWAKIQASQLTTIEGKYYGFSNETATSFNIEIIKNDTLKGSSFGNPARKYIQTNANEFSAVDLQDLKLKIQPDGLTIHYQQFDIGAFWKINQKSNIRANDVEGAYSSPSINEGIWSISMSEDDIKVVTPRSKTFTAIRVAENLFILKEMNLLLLFEKETNNVTLKLIHRGAGEVILQKV
jgi:CubicO group peptidase (beta-lactamase class C family)